MQRGITPVCPRLINNDTILKIVTLVLPSFKRRHLNRVTRQASENFITNILTVVDLLHGNKLRACIVVPRVKKHPTSYTSNS